MHEYLIHPEFTLVLVWSKGRIASTHLLSAHSGTANCIDTSPKPSRALESLCRYYQNSAGSIDPDLPLDWQNIPPFRARVLKTLFWIVPWGSTVTYSRLAAMAGSPGGARAVGTAMAHNPWPVIIPCHRVIRADKTLGGFSSGMAIKKKLLRLEGNCL
ncbi:MGMT family protein [Desulfonatronospira sp.]|uniref:methylated-DNA--[protein]-cysteine S-methyltransferase n=1 Tax=Desulfonatronospira sp. TaxID=1962951 RepID=UPI0025C6BA12|nr:MGMT family protein [Desulfonatronospira sp.]